MPRFSLIVATKDRCEDIAVLFRSLQSQQLKSFEVLIVDQNPDDRLTQILRQFADLPLRHLRCEPGLSHARNVALPLCAGEIVAFPDDDCWYPSDLLQNISDWFDRNAGLDLLTITMRDVSGRTSANHWKSDLCEIAPINVFRTTASSSIFVKRAACAPVRFDEALGVGSATSFGSGEDTDFVLSLLGRGAKGKFTRLWHVNHPMTVIAPGGSSMKRAVNYGRGMGYVLRKHRLPALGVLLFAFDIARAGLCSLTGRTSRALFCWHHGRGIVKGYLASGTAARV
jgi:glycosyltransferase involved in cell wall biosynthesis